MVWFRQQNAGENGTHVGDAIKEQLQNLEDRLFPARSDHDMKQLREFQEEGFIWIKFTLVCNWLL
jgi:hypothetical protein